MAGKIVRIGTRESKLAVWQAKKVASLLSKHGISSELVYIKTEGDKVLDTPLPLMGGKGVFTKALDDALYENSIDIAVHSYKDVPTEQPDGLITGAVCERDDPRDVFVFRSGVSPEILQDTSRTFHIATSSNRRMAQWLAKYPNTKISDIRGNVQTRMKKLENSDWDGVIFASAGLKRLGLHDKIGAYLDWMLPAPAQGALCIMCRESDSDILEILSLINDTNVALATGLERDFLNELEGGCSAPIGAFSQITNGKVHIEANILHLNGSSEIRIALESEIGYASNLGREAANQARRQGADKIVDALRS